MLFAEFSDVLRATSYLFAVAGASIGAVALWHNAKTNRARFVFDLTESFLKDEETLRFWYKLDYEEWVFSLKNFRQSNEERLIDVLLYRFSIIGQLLRKNSVSCRDLVNLYPIVRQFFTNAQIREYLRFNMLDFWRAAGHTQFHWPDAEYLYRELTRWHVKHGKSKASELEDCEWFFTEIGRVPFEKDLRHQIARRIEYDRDLS